MFRIPAATRGHVLAVSLLVLAACGSSSSDSGDPDGTFVVRTTSQGVASSTPLVIDDHWLAYLADESTTGAGGTDFNGDTDKIDQVPVRVNTASGAQTVLGVATEAIAFANRTLFLVVSEVDDGTIWNGDAALDDDVLLYHKPGDATPTFLATLAGSVDTPIVAVGDRLYFVADDPAAAGGAVADGLSNLFYVSVDVAGGDPSAPVQVAESVGDLGDGVEVEPLAWEGGILFLTVDEGVDGELNGDADSGDDILVLLNTDAMTGEVLSTDLAVDRDGDVAALQRQGDYWIAFLVDEAAQSQNLNDGDGLFGANWDPENCAGVDDDDQDDYILHWLLYTDFVGSGNVVNTGLVGNVGAGEYVYVHQQEFVGVVSYESEFGPAGCDLNDDGDVNDRIFRWVDASDPNAAVLPVKEVAKLVALPTNVPGSSDDSTGGVVAVSNLWVVIVDEAQDGRDYNGDIMGDAGYLTDQWVLAHVPANVGQGWNADHGTGVPGPVGVTWMADDPRNEDRFLAAISEAALDQDFNGDGDKLDSVPTFPSKVSGSTLTFPGIGEAVEQANAGLVTASGIAYYRVSEADEDRDLNKDGDKTDQMLQRVGIASGGPVTMSTLGNFDGPAAVLGPDKAQVGAFLVQEAQFGPAGTDLNKDGDATDVVVRYFRL